MSVQRPRQNGLLPLCQKSDTVWIEQLGLDEDQGGLLADVTGKLQALNRNQRRMPST